MPKKVRTEIPQEIAARVLFEADRTCCVCRVRVKPVQIHHLNEDPSNHALPNLAVLCFDCHRETQIRGGFDRKLDGEQIALYRADWVHVVAQQRSRESAVHDAERARDQHDIALATSLAEMYREEKAYVELAIHYNVLGNSDLRDKYIEVAIQDGVIDEEIFCLRGLQERPDLIPAEVAQRHLDELAKEQNWHNRARALRTLGLHEAAVRDYLRSVNQSLDKKRPHSAAFYLREVAESGLIDELFAHALAQAREDGDLWWQVRALQELGWNDELRRLILANEQTIEVMTDDHGAPARLKELLAVIRGDDAGAAHIREQRERTECFRVRPTSELPNQALQPTSQKRRRKQLKRAKPARG